MNKRRLILYFSFLFVSLFLIQYYNIADAQIKGGSNPPSIEITAPTKNSDVTITDTTIYIVDDNEFDVNSIQIEEITTVDTSNLNCNYSAEMIICGVAGCDISPPRANCTLSIETTGDLYVSITDNDSQKTTIGELGYIIQENQIQQSQSSNSNTTTSRSHRIRFTCKDQKAINYNNFGRHDKSLCEYPKKVSISEAMVLQLIDLLENLKEQLLFQ